MSMLKSFKKMRASHILLSFKGAKNSTHSRGVGEAMKEGERITKELKDGGVSFDQLARENSACPSKDKGGELGWFEPTDMALEFTTACNQIPIGELGPHPFVTEFGVHVIWRTG